MMKNKMIILLFTVILACSAGVSGVIPLAIEEDTTDSAKQKDRLIGVYVTRDYINLFDAEQYLQDNIDDIDDILTGGTIIGTEDAETYTNRLYGVETEIPAVNEETGTSYMYTDFVFPGTEGFGTYCYRKEEEHGPVSVSAGGTGISDGHTHITTTDYGNNLALTGTIYVSVDAADNSFYINPVYQSADGSIYLLPGSGVSFGSNIEGMKHTTTLSEEETITVDGESVVAYSVEVELHVESVLPPETVHILQLDKDSTVLARTEYAADALPKSLTILSGTEYIIAESYSAGNDPVITRQLFQKEDSYMNLICPWEEDICIKKDIRLDWSK